MRVAAGFLVSLALAGCSCAAIGGTTPAEVLLDRLRKVAASPNYYWAWTGSWLRDWDSAGDTRNVVSVGSHYLPKPTKDVELSCSYQKYANGRRAVINYADLCSVTGTWHDDDYYRINRAGLTAAVKRQWLEFGGVMVFSWHMDHPYCVYGFKKDSYRFKSEGANRNVIRQILEGAGDLCGSDTISGANKRVPCKNPRTWYVKSLQEVADFLNGLIDDETGKKIPVIIRYPHEMDGDWFWWGRTWCSADEYRRFCMATAAYLRRKCPGQILFAYTPDRTWSEFGEEGDAGNTFLAYYPGDAYSDIVGLDDYSIGNGDDEKVELNCQETVRKLRLISSFAADRGKVAVIAESGGKDRRDDFWRYLHRAATADGVSVAFVNTWSWIYGTTPQNENSEKEERAFAMHPQVLMEALGNGFRIAASN